MFCWELGGGLGHMMQMLPLARDLVRAGHRVFVAQRELERATPFLGRAGVSFLPAPVCAAPNVRFPRPVTYAQMLINAGFGSYDELFAPACAWRNLLRLVAPDLVIFDHSPTALLASRGLPCRRALIGSGFCVPPDHDDDRPWAVLRPAAAGRAGHEALRQDEQRLLGRMNRVLAGGGQPPLERPGQLFSEVDETFLTTFPELDPFGSRRGGGYWGPVLVGAESGGDAPHWPDTPGRRVYAYLKTCAALPEALEALRDSRQPTVAYVDGAEPLLTARFASDTLSFAARPLDLGRVARECDLAVVNGGHGVTAEMLLAGRPLLQVPMAWEQRLTAEAVKRLGAGEAPKAGQQGTVRRALDAVLTNDGCARAARRFADRYAAFDRAKQRAAILARAEELLTGTGRAGGSAASPTPQSVGA